MVDEVDDCRRLGCLDQGVIMSLEGTRIYHFLLRRLEVMLVEGKEMIVPVAACV